MIVLILLIKVLKCWIPLSDMDVEFLRLTSSLVFSIWSQDNAQR